MSKQILHFKKTNHFLHSQWDRGIDDLMLYNILPYVNSTLWVKDVVMVLPSFLKKKRMAKDDKQCLVLVAEANLLVTAYWCDHPNYLFEKEENVRFQLLY